MLKQYIWLAAAVGLLASHAGLGVYAYRRGHSNGSADGKAAVAESIQSQYEAAATQLKADLTAARAMNATLRDVLATIPPSTTVREVIRANPSGCVTPGPVADSLLDHASRVDAAIRAGRGDGALPDPGAGRRLDRSPQ